MIYIILGGSVGGFVLIVTLISVICCCKKKRTIDVRPDEESGDKVGAASSLHNEKFESPDEKKIV